jgi:hypothetical protein
VASSPTSSPAMRYWNMARQRYYRPSARCCRALRVSADRAARPGPHTRGKPRLLDLERRVPAKVRFARDSPLEEGVYCELVSGTPNSLLAGKIQEISSIWGLVAQIDPEKQQ